MKRITSAEAKELNQNFVETRSKAIDVAIKKKDALSSWFSMDELKNFIASVEKEGIDKGITVNGIRIYFGAYTSDDKNPEIKNLSTVFLVPTQAKIGAMQTDGLANEIASSDITDIDGMNRGGLGYPPSATYPQ
ncbi:MAG: hypothetical protein PHW92_08010 [Lutibacter sp.]|nr:hypothetical protein [Lutibacter sp.]